MLYTFMFSKEVFPNNMSLAKGHLYQEGGRRGKEGRQRRGGGKEGASQGLHSGNTSQEGGREGGRREREAGRRGGREGSRQERGEGGS